MHSYEPAKIEKKWQAYWENNQTFVVQEDPSKPKYYVLDMFPYPSGAGLHVGHPEGYVATDIIARFKRMQGFQVLHPMGWDAFGLPAEQYAVKTGVHPAQTTAKNIETFKRQIQSLGLSYDWSREINTTDPHYYKWTQWIFLKLYEKGLAYESEEMVNWCPQLNAVLANEEVVDGKSEVGGYPVERKPMRQWVLAITKYAESLLDGLKDLDWPEAILEQQRHWIGKSVGTDVRFKTTQEGLDIEVFTTRVDTLFGVSFLCVSPEFEGLAGLSETCLQYQKKGRARSDRERQQLKEKTGVKTAIEAIHPLTGERIPIFIADYVIGSYGHGAVMGVPAHDERDHTFALKYDLPIKQVILGPKDQKDLPYEGYGKLVDSEEYSGLVSEEAISKIQDVLEKNGQGRKKVQYKLRDWLFSRQRYWGEPIPILHDGKGDYRVEDQLPLTLPEVEDFRPAETGESPLAKADRWRLVEKDGQQYIRETNTMPQWAGSCWYYLRFCDPQNDAEPFAKEKESYWMPVDLYVGGAEHAVLHLLYARFWHHVLYDLELVSTKEPFKKLVNQGMILGENNEKMSKSRGNVVNPDDVIDEWGADAMRLYEMFMGPLTATKPWKTDGLVGIHRFLSRVWRMMVDEKTGGLSTWLRDEQDAALESFWHKTLQKVGKDIEGLSFNTAISQFMEFVNEVYQRQQIPRRVAEDFVLALAPFAPHLCEEIWEKLGRSSTLAFESWPIVDMTKIIEDTIEIPVQVNGKKRGSLHIAPTAEKDVVMAEAKAVVEKYLQGKKLVKEIYVPKRIVNLVIN